MSDLTDHLWQSTLFASGAGLLAFTLRKDRAQARYWLWLMVATARTFVVTGALAFGLIGAPAGRAQSIAAETSGTKPKFEIASIKLNKSGANVIGMTRSPGMIAIRDCPLEVLIEEAYALYPYQISGGPHWVDTDKYDIVAKVHGKANFSQKMHMLQALLADRFQLRMRREVRTMRVYSLVIAKGGPKLRVPNAKERQGLRITDNGFIGHKVPMRQLAWGLTSPLHLPVVDRTGLRGGFDFTLNYVPGEESLEANSNRPSGPSLFTALQEQLGLKLKPGKGPVTVYVIDHVERPSAN